MATTTPNLGMTLPAVSDAADIGALNGNFQKIDNELGGKGLGVSSVNTSFIDTVAKLDALRVNRWFIFTGYSNGDPIHASGLTIHYAYGRIDSYNENNAKMTLWPYNPADPYNKCELTRYCIENVWQPWEWVNPPMIPGVEYRTTERWNGKPVYTKAVNCGAMGQNTVDDVYHDAVNIEVVWVSGGYWTDGGTRFSLPYIGGADDNQIFVSAYGSAIHRVHKGSVYNILDMTVMIKYTKSTD